MGFRRSTVIDVSLKSLGTLGKALSAVLALLILASPAPVHASQAQELFADGNRLFRDELYWAALLRFRQASDAGLKSPLLDYNMGVAHYRAGQHVRARESLKKAARSPRLEIIAHYNLGLNAWKMGDYDDALQWLRKARDQEQDKKIRKLAVRAIEAMQKDSFDEESIVVQIEKKEKERKIGNFVFNARVGAGTDSNVFRTPSEPYVDQSDPTLPLITPEVQSGMYVPVNLGAKYVVNSFDHESFFAGYRLAGRFFPDEELENGNEYVHELAFGSKYDKRTETRRRQVYSAFTIAQHDEVYYNRDDGEIRTFQGQNIDDRFNYLRYGPEFSFRQGLNRFSFGLRIKGQLWNYENTQVVPEYDHTFLLGGLNLQYQFSETSLVRVTAEAFHRKFGDRPSFELDGTQPVNNPGVEYNYFQAGLTARQRVFGGFWFGMDYKYRIREDMYVGYNDYGMHEFGTEIHLDIGDRFALDAEAVYRLYDYENAFAFNNPAAGPKTLERGFGAAELTYRISQSFTLVGQFRVELVESNDARIAYDRNTIFVALRWDL